MAGQALACPRCGDPSQPIPVARVVRCTACAAALYVEDPPTPHVMVEPRLDRAQALAATRAWMHDVRHRELLAWRARLEPARLVYLPFARIEASVLGTIYGKRKHTDDKRTWYTDEELAIAEDFVTTEPLSAVGELGVERLPDLAAVAQPAFDEVAIAARQGEVVPALASELTATERAHASFLANVHAAHDLDSITGEALSVIGARETFVHYPFWRVDYRAGRAGYVAMIDASSGQVAYGRAPGSMLFHAAFYGVVMPLAAIVVLVAVVLAGFIFAFAGDVSDVSSKVGGVIFAVGGAIGIAGIAAGAWLGVVGHRGLKQAGEVESGYAAHAGAALLDTHDDAYRASLAKERAEVDRDPDLVKLEATP